MNKEFDTIVVGIGGHGSAALYHLAKQGQKVLGLEQFTVAHDRGSSHGHSRIIRLQYHEHPDYVPLLRRAYELWHQLEEETQQELLKVTGCLELAPASVPDSCYQHALDSVHEHNLEYDDLTSEQVNERFPGYHLPPNYKALFQPQGGLLIPEKCIEAHTAAAKKHGAELHTGEKAQHWRILPGGKVEVKTDKATYRAAKLVLTAGAWISQLVPELQGVARAQRQVVAWFEVADHAAFSPENFPVFILQDERKGMFYGFPEFGGSPGVKIGKFYHLFEACEDPDLVSRNITQQDEELLREALRQFFPKADGKMLSAAVCMFTNTPDEHFIIDFHPRHPQVVLCSACSGHGYKFCSVIGELLADLVLRGRSQNSIGIHRISSKRPGTAELLCARSPTPRL